MTPLAWVSVTVLANEVDGHPARADELQFPALVNYGHFTALQVRKRAVRGLDRHLQRLDTATRELYDTGLPASRVLRHIRHALGDHADATVRVSVFQADPGLEPSVMVTVRPAAAAAGVPQRLQSVTFRRALPHIKHAGTFGQIHYGRVAEQNGFDDALFTEDGSVVSESATANLAGYGGGAVSWPDAPQLHGITMQLLEHALPAAGVTTRRQRITLDELRSFDAVFLTNSLGIAAVGQVDERRLHISPSVLEALTGVYESIPWDPI